MTEHYRECGQGKEREGRLQEMELLREKEREGGTVREGAC